MKNYFFGRYFKCQSDTQTLALIPAVHRDGKEHACSVQLITDSGAWNARFSSEKFKISGDCITIDNSRFGKTGIELDLHTPQLTASGTLRFGKLSPIKYDIMGPFGYVPFMECSHSVLSMRHSVSGTLDINGNPYHFHSADGYIEGDSGHSFPTEYVWTQCFFEGGSLMLSAAEIPFGGLRFTGVICVIHFHGNEYRLATYLGAKAILIKNGEIIIRQGGDVLTVRLPKQTGRKLHAPEGGAMTRTIRESLSCRAYYRFRRDSGTIFEFETDKASFEYEYGE